jgi:hypothetical protein
MIGNEKTAMNRDHRRYFIELQPEGATPVPRNREAETRREQATLFVETVYGWLRSHDLDDKVSEMDVTMFGQVQITCEAEIINRIRDEDALSIAAIRPGALYVEGMNRTVRR